MQITIVSDIPGRLRVRTAPGLFTPDEVRGITRSLLECPGVTKAQVHRYNGSILVQHDPRSRSEVLRLLDSLDVLHLPCASVGVDILSNQIELATENNRFMVALTRVVGLHYVTRLFMPAPIRTVLAIIKSIRFFIKALKALAHGKLSVEVLDATAIGAALVRASFTEASTIMFFLDLSATMEEHVHNRVHLALRDGVMTRAEKVWLYEDGQDREIPAEEIQVGQTLHLLQGHVLPIDGTVLSGEAEIDESKMTGEAQLAHKTEGSIVYAGSALEEGDLYVRVDAPSGSARIDQIVKMVEESSELKAGAQSKAERLADRLVPVSYGAFLGILVLTRNMTTALSVLMVDYSCAIKFTMPIAVMSTLREANRRSIVIKGGRYLEALAEADTIVFDKTGTLTSATPQVTEVFSADGTAHDEILRISACIEEHFPHSLARAVVSAARENDLSHSPELHDKVSYQVAHGIATTIEGHDTLLGSAHYLFEDSHIACPDGFAEHIRRLYPTASIVYLAQDGQLKGALAIADPLRPEARKTIGDLRALGIRHVVMLTGDTAQVAEVVAREVNTDAFHAQVLPDEKCAFIRELQQRGHTVIMVGDGVNDSPALAEADVSIALSDASDLARAVADISISSRSLTPIVVARRIAQGLMKRIKRDYAGILAINTALIALGMRGMISLTTASALHNISTFTVATSNMRPLLEEDYFAAHRMRRQQLHRLVERSCTHSGDRRVR